MRPNKYQKMGAGTGIVRTSQLQLAGRVRRGAGNAGIAMGKKEKHGPGPPSLSQGRISKYFGKPSGQQPSIAHNQGAHGAENNGAAEAPLVVPGRKQGPAAAGGRGTAPGAPPPRPPRQGPIGLAPVQPLHRGHLDNMLLSQDADDEALKVVWASSPPKAATSLTSAKPAKQGVSGNSLPPQQGQAAASSAAAATASCARQGAASHGSQGQEVEQQPPQVVLGAAAGSSSDQHVEGGSQSSREDLKRSLIQAVQDSRHLTAAGQGPDHLMKGSRGQVTSTNTIVLGPGKLDQKKRAGGASKLRQAVITTLGSQLTGGSQPGSGNTSSSQVEAAGKLGSGSQDKGAGLAGVDAAEADAVERTSRSMLDEILASLGPLRHTSSAVPAKQPVAPPQPHKQQQEQQPGKQDACRRVVSSPEAPAACPPTQAVIHKEEQQQQAPLLDQQHAAEAAGCVPSSLPNGADSAQAHGTCSDNSEPQLGTAVPATLPSTAQGTTAGPSCSCTPHTEAAEVHEAGQCAQKGLGQGKQADKQVQQEQERALGADGEEDERVLAEVLAEAVTEASKTPGSLLRSARVGVKRGRGGDLSTGLGTATGRKRGRVTPARPLGSGHKRRLLLDMLDKVEELVKVDGDEGMGLVVGNVQGGSLPVAEEQRRVQDVSIAQHDASLPKAKSGATPPPCKAASQLFSFMGEASAPGPNREAGNPTQASELKQGMSEHSSASPSVIRASNLSTQVGSSQQEAAAAAAAASRQEYEQLLADLENQPPVQLQPHDQQQGCIPQASQQQGGPQMSQQQGHQGLRPQVWHPPPAPPPPGPRPAWQQPGPMPQQRQYQQQQHTLAPSQTWQGSGSGWPHKQQQVSTQQQQQHNHPHQQQQQQMLSQQGLTYHAQPQLQQQQQQVSLHPKANQGSQMPQHLQAPSMRAFGPPVQAQNASNNLRPLHPQPLQGHQHRRPTLHDIHNTLPASQQHQKAAQMPHGVGGDKLQAPQPWASAPAQSQHAHQLHQGQGQQHFQHAHHQHQQLQQQQQQQPPSSHHQILYPRPPPPLAPGTTTTSSAAVPQQPPGAPTQAQVQLGTSWQQVGGHADGQGQPYLQQQQQPYPQHHPHPQQHPPAQVTVQGQGHQPQAIGRLAGGREGVMYTVLQVEEATQGGSERVLRAVSPYQGSEVWVHLRHPWVDMPVRPGDVINLIAQVQPPGPDGRRHATCDCDQGLVILHPDILLSGTAITSAVECTRKAWLQELVGGSSNARAVMGTLQHELLQVALRSAVQQPLDRMQLMEQARLVVSSSSAKLLEVGLEEGAAVRELQSKVDGVMGMLAKYVAPHPGPGNELQMGPNHQGPAPQMCIREVSDIEETIWAPRYGLKGQLDGTLKVSWKEPNNTQTTLPQVWRGNHLATRNPQPVDWQLSSSHHATAGGRGSGGWMGDAAVQQGPRHSWGPASSNSAYAHHLGQQQPPQQPQPQRHSGGGAVASHTGGGQEHIAVVPFEFKSGRHHHSHRAQVLLYQMLVHDRYLEPCSTGLLWNSNDGPTMHAVTRSHGELAALLMHRNRLAASLTGIVRNPPPMLDSEHTCSTCFMAPACALYHKAVEGGGCESSGMSPAQWHALTSHLSSNHTSFFSHWTALVDAEESGAREGRRQLWALSGAEREVTEGACVAGLKLVAYRPPHQVVGSSQPLHCYRFAKIQGDQQRASGPQCQQHQQVESATAGVQAGSLGSVQQPVPSVAAAATAAAASQQEAWTPSGCGFTEGDSALLSLDGQHVNVARVTIGTVDESGIQVLCRKAIRLAAECLTQHQHQGHHQQPSPAAVTCSCSWRLDKDESASIVTLMRSNLVDLMAPPPEALAQAAAAAGGRAGREPGGSGATPQRGRHARRLRELICDLAQPLQQRAPPPEQQGPDQATQAGPLTQALHSGSMNQDQVAAVRGVLEMQDYALILGMPGTGKTSTIVHTIQALVSAGRTILLTAYTNSAVDNICLKLAAAGVGFVRLVGSNTQAVHPGVRQYTLGGSKYPHGNTVQGMAEVQATVQVMAVTCLGVRHPLLARRSFDVCILDEASQVSLPACLGPLLLARTFVLVGDHYQLPPLVSNHLAAQGGLGVSLFRRLSEAHPQAVITLRRQYRMAADIMAISNRLIYSGALLCGSQAVAQGRMALPGFPHALSAHRVPDWVMQVVDPARRVVFLNTDSVPGCEDSQVQEGVTNPGEADLLAQVVGALLRVGAEPGDLGLVSPYRAQVSLLQRKMQGVLSDSSRGGPQPGGQEQGGPCPSDSLEVLTVDKYQGRDKSCILLSWVRSNSSRAPGQLLADWQRLNVALTRAKHKLVMVGSCATISSVPLLAELVNMAASNGWLASPVV